MDKIGFIGAGNMASSLIGGMISAGMDVHDIRAYDPSPSTQAEQLGIMFMPDNESLVTWANTLVLAVKPQAMPDVCRQIADAIDPQRHLIISVAAGITTDSITKWLGQQLACIRVMPNTPALLGQGMSGIYANPLVSPDRVQTTMQILSTVGKVLEFEHEKTIDAVTAVSGSGPAYFFLLMEAMIQAAVRQGLAEDDARILVLQTAIGAAAMAQDSDVDIAELRRRVTSPGGTTERAIQTMLDGDFMQLVEQAVDAAARRSVELSKEMSGNN